MTNAVTQSYDEQVGEPTVHPTDEPIADPTAAQGDVVEDGTTGPEVDGSVDGVDGGDGEDGAEPAAADPLEEFRAALREKFGDWFVVHTYSGM